MILARLQTTIQVSHEAYELRLLCSPKVRQLHSVDGRRSKVVDVAMDATRLEVDLKPQQSMVSDVREEVCVDANVEMSTRRDVVRPDVVDATARWTKNTFDDVCEAWMDAGVRIQQTIGVGVAGVGQAVDGSSRRYGSRMKRERTRQTIVEGESR